MTALRLTRPRRLRPAAILIAAIVVVAATQLAARLRPATALAPNSGQAPVTVTAPIDVPGAPLGGFDDVKQIDHSIAAWTANLAANAKDFISAGNLAALYEARARLSGEVGDYGRAQEAANRSLAIEPKQVDVLALHARLALATHDFQRALGEAQTLDHSAPDQPAILAIIADAQLELGDVDTASATYGRIQSIIPSPAINARLARVAFLRGDPATAIREAEAAQSDAASSGVAGPSLSWYSYVAGTMRLMSGDPEGAARWFDTALREWPGSFLALAGRARAAAALGDTDAAVADYRAAIAVAPQPDALTALGDLLAMRGDDRGAREQYDTVLAIAKLQGSAGLVFNRQLVLFDVNHGRDAATALSLAEQELAVRKDVYGYDAQAWALLANGRASDADAAMARALALGTRDATLLYHAGEIARALGDASRARNLLSDALAIRGGLDPLAASRAQADLAALR
jgi:tetratricopeptide (TPR) repeat protein